MKRRGFRHNDHDVCLVKLVTETGVVIAAIAVHDFLATASTQEAMDEFYEFLNARYDVKRLGKPTRYLGWYFQYRKNGDIALSKQLLIDQTLAEAGMAGCNFKQTPYNEGMAYHAPAQEDEHKPETVTKFKKLIGELRYLADCTMPDLSFIVGRVGAAAANPPTRHWQMMKSTMRYLAGTRDYGLL